MTIRRILPIALLAFGVGVPVSRAEVDVDNLCRPYFKAAVAEARTLTGVTTLATYLTGSYKLYFTDGQITDRGCDFIVKFAFERREMGLQLIWPDRWLLQNDSAI